MMSALWLTCSETTLIISVPRKVRMTSQDSKLVEYILNRNDFLNRVELRRIILCRWVSVLTSLLPSGLISKAKVYPCTCLPLSTWYDTGLWINLNAPEVVFLLPFQLQELLLLRDGTFNLSLKQVGQAYYYFYCTSSCSFSFFGFNCSGHS